MISQVLTRFIHAIWLGSGLFLMLVAAPAAFRASGSAAAAADVVGAMLQRWHYLALAAPLALLFLDWKRARVSVLLIVFMAIMLAAMQTVIDMRIRAIRARSTVPISELSRQDPIRRQFGMLHGVSSLLLLGQVLMAGAALAVDKEAYRRREEPAPVTEQTTAETAVAPPEIPN
jgi:hypothetical protein